MNTKTITRHYASLTPEERFRLIVAAGARGDKAEQGRLVSAGRRITLSMQDHAPHAHAFSALSLHTFIELLADAADYFEALHRPDDATDFTDDEPDDNTAEQAEDEDAGEVAENEGRTIADDWFSLALAREFILKTKANGWKLYCERMSIPPFASWTFLPGFDRLQRSLTVAEKAALVLEGMVRTWQSQPTPYSSSHPCRLGDPRGQPQGPDRAFGGCGRVRTWAERHRRVPVPHRGLPEQQPWNKPVVKAGAETSQRQ